MRVKIDIPNNVFQLPSLSAELLVDPTFLVDANWLAWNATESTTPGIELNADASVSTQAVAVALVTSIYVLKVNVATIPAGRSLRLFTSDADGMRQKISKPITHTGEATFAIDPGIAGPLRVGMLASGGDDPIVVNSLSCKLVSPLPEFSYYSLSDIITAQRASVGTGVNHLGVLTEYAPNEARIDFSEGSGVLIKEGAATNLNNIADWYATDGIELNTTTSILGPDLKPTAAECNFLNNKVYRPTIRLYTNREITQDYNINFWIKASTAHAGHVLRLQTGTDEQEITLTDSWQNIRQSFQLRRGYSIQLVSHPDDNDDASALVMALSHVMINIGDPSTYVKNTRTAEKLYLQPLAYRLFKVHGASEFTLSGVNVSLVENEEII